MKDTLVSKGLGCFFAVKDDELKPTIFMADN